MAAPGGRRTVGVSMNESLACPRCFAALEPDHGIHVCRACRGGFVRESVLVEMVAALGGEGVRYQLRTGPVVACPACGDQMVATAIEGVPVDRCFHGIWFDADELEPAVVRTAAAGRVPTQTVASSDTDVVEVVDVVVEGGSIGLWLVEIVGGIFDAA